MKSSWLVLTAVVGVFLFSCTPSARADDASHLQAARDLLLAMHMDSSYAKTVDQMVDAQIRQAPQLAKLRAPMKDFLTKYMGWDAMKDDLAQLFANNFTEQELKEITAFYQTPTGSKLALSLPDLTSQGLALGQKKVADHIGELRLVIQKGLAHDDSSSGTSAPASDQAPAPSPAPADGQ